MSPLQIINLRFIVEGDLTINLSIVNRRGGSGSNWPDYKSPILHCIKFLSSVEIAVRCLEDDPTFNAGHGSSLNTAGQIEMDAIIMDGSMKYPSLAS